MPDYSLNWKAKSSAIQGWQRCQWCSSSTRRWLSQSWGPFGLKSIMEHWPSSTNAKQSAEKPLQEAAADRAFLFMLHQNDAGLAIKPRLMTLESPARFSDGLTIEISELRRYPCLQVIFGLARSFVGFSLNHSPTHNKGNLAAWLIW